MGIARLFLGLLWLPHRLSRGYRWRHSMCQELNASHPCQAAAEDRQVLQVI